MEESGKRELHKKICVDLLLSSLTVVFVILLGPKLIRFFMPLIIAWVIASIANPMVQFLEDRIKIMRKHGSVIVIVSVLLLVGGLLYLVVRAVIVQVMSLVGDLPDIYRQVITNLQASLGAIHQHFKFIPGNVQGFLNKYNDKLNEIILSSFDTLRDSSISLLGSFASSVIDMLVLFILTLMLSYFFVVKRQQIKEYVRKYMPQGLKEFWGMAMDACFRALAGYLKACFQIMLVIFVILWAIFVGVIHIDHATILAWIAAILDFLPFLGTGFLLTPWAVYCIITGEYLKAVVLALAYAICLTVHRLLEPKLVGDSVGMSPFATLVSMFIGYRLIGMLGLILGIPVGMVLFSFKENGIFDPYIRGVKILANDLKEYRKY